MIILRGLKSKFLITRGYGKKLLEEIIKLVTKFYRIITLNTLFKKQDIILLNTKFYNLIGLNTKFASNLFDSRKITLKTKFSFNISLNSKFHWEKR